MEQFLYTTFIALDAWLVGAGVFGAYMSFRLALFLSNAKRRRAVYSGLAQAAWSGTQGILLWAVSAGGSVTPDLRAFAYMTLLAIGGFALTAMAGLDRDSLAEFIAIKDHEGGE